MMDASAQQQFAEACARSASEMTAASIIAASEAAANAIGMWAQTADIWLSAIPGWTRRPRSSFRASFPPAPRSGLSPSYLPHALQAWTAGPSPIVAAWLGLYATARALGPFPLAGAMIAAGFPAQTAWPAARAGHAALDAAEIAARAVERAFSSYRSDGGHAVAQIVTSPMSGATADARPAVWAFGPWLLMTKSG
jgi:hypothetical protein